VTLFGPEVTLPYLELAWCLGNYSRGWGGVKATLLGPDVLVR